MDEMIESDGPRSERTTVRKHAERGVYDRRTIYGILDEGLICHVGFVDDGQPFVIPTVHVRVDDRLYVHGSQSSRMMGCLRRGVPACVTVTLLDGLVLARSSFSHSMNYRSVVVLGEAEDVVDSGVKMTVFEALVEQVVPGRWKDARPPSASEVDATAVVCFPLDEASAKVRSGPPVDVEADYGLEVWAGVIPLRLCPAAPVTDPRSSSSAAPDYAVNYRRPTDGATSS